ncbi:MAG: glycine reductase [Candidatus Nealsonbacteria bacterium]|nr:glycine reductase [Candidatus Nealsonbacteria bacterium]
MKPVIKGSAYVLAHVPDLVRYGSKPYREIEKDPNLLPKIEKNLRRFLDVVAYPPNQVFIGNLTPDELRNIPQPWFENKLFSASSCGNFGEIVGENNFYGVLKLADANGYDLVWIENKFLSDIKKFGINIFFDEQSSQKMGEGKTIAEIQEKLALGPRMALPLFHNEKLIGCFNRSQDPHAQEDEALGPHPLMEGLAAKASGALALKHLIEKLKMSPEEIDFIISCSEEAVGDRYNRGGGSLAKAIGEMCGCINATGPDIKAFCVSPIYAIIVAASLVKAGVFKKVAVVGGGCLAKLGMKFQGHLESGYPIIEDTLGAAAFLIASDDRKSPIIRLDAIGKNNIKNSARQEDVTRAVVLEPLKKLGKRIIDIDKYAVQLENPEITVPSKTGDVPKKNYDMIAGLAVLNKEITPQEMAEFVKIRGMPGFAPTQGHIPAAVPYLGHAIEAIKNGGIKNAMFIARGSLFLGRMSQLHDGMSFIIEKNPKQKEAKKCLRKKRP